MAAILELGEDTSNGGVVERSNGDAARTLAALPTNPVPRNGPGRRYRVFEAAPQDPRGMPAKKPVADYFLVGSSPLAFLTRGYAYDRFITDFSCCSNSLHSPRYPKLHTEMALI